MSGPLEQFLAKVHHDCVDGYAAGVREDARDVEAGRSNYGREECPDCGQFVRLRNRGEDGRCSSCTASR